MDAIDCQIQDEFGFYTRTTDGVSGMTVTALADFCGVEQPAISQMLNKIRDFDPITKDLPKCLESFAGKEWRLITNDEQNSLFVIDELCHAILEYYAIDAIALNNSICSKSADDINEFPPEENSPQKHAVAGEKEEVDWNKLAQQTEDWEQPEITHYVQDIEQDNSISSKDSHEDNFSGGAVEEVEVDTTLDKQNKSEIREICTELKRLRINPEPCLGVIKKHWENVQDAIARVKEAINEGWCNNPTGLFINSCKSGEKPKNTVDAGVKSWFESLRRERIVIAMSAGIVYTVDGEAVEIGEMMRRYPGGSTNTNS